MNRARIVSVRFTAEQREALDQLARTAGVSVSEYIRGLVADQAKVTVVKLDPREYVPIPAPWPITVYWPDGSTTLDWTWDPTLRGSSRPAERDEVKPNA